MALRSLLGLIEEDASAQRLAREGGHAFVSSSLRPYAIAALADFGPAGDAQSVSTARPVNQATGVAGQEFPDEFKSGLDAYFSLLEKQAAGK